MKENGDKDCHNQVNYKVKKIKTLNVSPRIGSAIASQSTILTHEEIFCVTRFSKLWTLGCYASKPTL